MTSDSERFDLAVVGAGIVGLAHAWEAHRRGLRVVILERDERAVAASVRNFGHGFVSGTAPGEPFECALEARRRWLELAPKAGFWAAETGSLILARADDELAVLEQFVAERGREARILSAAEARRHAPVATDGVRGGLLTPLDLRVDPRAAIPGVAALLVRRGVEVRFGAAVNAVEPPLLRTGAGEVRADLAVVCPGHDFETLFPAVFRRNGLVRTKLQMLRVAAPASLRLEPALLTGLSLIHYPGFADLSAAVGLRERLERERADVIAAGMHLIVTQRPDGSLIVGDTHEYARTPSPFRDEGYDRMLIDEAAAVLGLPGLDVLERWLGVYASSGAGRPFLVEAPRPGVRVVAVTAGIGMTTALGLAPRVLDGLLGGAEAG